MRAILLIFLGGGLGSVIRFLISKSVVISGNSFPFATFLVNIIGSLLIGVILGWALKENSISQNTVLFLATGFCGGFTTFSAFAYENLIFLKTGDFTSFLLYTIGSLIVGILAVFIGIWLVRII